MKSDKLKKENSQLLVSRQYKKEDTVINVKQAVFGGSSHMLIAGPCSVEGSAFNRCYVVKESWCNRSTWWGFQTENFAIRFSGVRGSRLKNHEGSSG